MIDGQREGERKRVEIRVKINIDYLRECGPHTHVKLQIELEIVKNELTKILLQCDIVLLKSDYKDSNQIFILFK